MVLRKITEIRYYDQLAHRFAERRIQNRERLMRNKKQAREMRA